MNYHLCNNHKNDQMIMSLQKMIIQLKERPIDLNSIEKNMPTIFDLLV